MKESALETVFFNRIRDLGGIAIKLMPTHAGVPDRLVLLPGGRSFLVELKADQGRVDPIQRLWHSKSAELGHPVVVLKGRREVDSWVDAQVLPCRECGNDDGPHGGLCSDCLEAT